LVRIGFIGCHEVSFHCFKKICNLANEFNDIISIAFDLLPEEASKYSASTNLEPLQNEFNFPLHHVKNIIDKENNSMISNANLDVLFIIGWHRIVPQSILDHAKICIGLHTSMLPEDRGSSPINWQLIRGSKKGGVSLFHLTPDVDSGDVIDQKEFLIDFNDDVKTVYFKSILASLDLLENNWLDIHNLKPNQIIQNEEKITFNSRRKPNDGLIDWTKSSIDCYNWIRALTFPYPGAFTFWNGKKLLIWKAIISNKKEKEKPGTIIETEKNFLISTGDASLEITLLQVENEPLCNSEVFKKSYGLKEKDIFQNS